ncbi:hypothetical protein KVT40_008064 [Elsinoe batatas]|uniref:Uncharacterized protein n=1 Tax=Elsinoe batatas TaxID=2601811 RepID=A0A8K0KUX2_9PEZI|nr:hypothetical protein KVT40_008064 [Elsinoe batatas]
MIGHHRNMGLEESSLWRHPHLYYFRDQKDENAAICAPSGSHPPTTVAPVLPEETGSAIINGQTFTAPSAYVMYNNLTYIYGSGNMSSTWAKETTYLTFKKEHVHSVCRVGATTVLYNFRDLYGELPWSAEGGGWDEGELRTCWAGHRLEDAGDGGRQWRRGDSRWEGNQNCQNDWYGDGVSHENSDNNSGEEWLHGRTGWLYSWKSGNETGQCYPGGSDRSC